VIAPGATIGILGGGQLGMMLAQAAKKMGYRTHIFCPDRDSPAFAVCDEKTIARYDDRAELTTFAGKVDVITYEFENIPSDPVYALAKLRPVYPDPDVLAVCQHRVLEKQALNNMGVATAPFAAVSNKDELEAALRKIGGNAVLKTATMGYDGKGQWRFRQEVDIDTIWSDVLRSNNQTPPELILEGYVLFRMEISVIVARDDKGNVECYCPVENTHKNHILDETVAPAPISPTLAKEAERIARTIAQGLKLVGIMAVEMFITKDDKILVNELAPRPHNSGHWTIDACDVSQFEQTIRAVCGLPLGDPRRHHDARMLNLIGDDIKDAEKHRATGGIVHLYGKKESRPGRKMGHVTWLVSNR
jgi:5-(carboxyamino)imidazole ribonucleotide synthase